MPARGGRHQYQSRFGLSGDERDSTNHGCSSDVWLTTRSMTSFIPRSCTAAEQRVELLERPEHRLDVLVVADVVAGVVLRRRVDRRQPEHVDAERRRGSRGATAIPAEVADPVAVASRRSCAGRSGRRPRSSTTARRSALTRAASYREVNARRSVRRSALTRAQAPRGERVPLGGSPVGFDTGGKLPRGERGPLATVPSVLIAGRSFNGPCFGSPLRWLSLPCAWTYGVPDKGTKA